MANFFSKIKNSQEYINLFRRQSSGTKLNRGRDPILGRFRLRKRTLLNIQNDPKIKVPVGSAGFPLKTKSELTERLNQPLKTLSKRKLEERSHLVFEFQGQPENKRAYLPFIENIQITESNKSTLAPYSLLGRAGQIFSYQGAESRVFKIKFSFKLLHLLHLYSTEGLDNKFLFHFLDYENRKVGGVKNPIDHARIHKKYYSDIAGPQDAYNFEGLGISTAATFKSNSIVPGLGASNLDILRARREKVEFAVTGPVKASITITDLAINAIIYWVNLVRSSTKNNSANTTFGPPIVKLNHGPMYNSVPCVVQDYSITIDEMAGYDSFTMFPRGIDISLDLLEVRTGNFGTFKSFDKALGDNNVGWEAVFDENNMDPYNGLITR